MSYAIGIGIVIASMWIAGVYIGGNNIVLWGAGVLTICLAYGGTSQK